MKYGLCYFAAASVDPASSGGVYRLLLDGARFADSHGFTSVWMPERHFHPFGGHYPNPAVTGAAVAAVTRDLDIRAGSVVAALHHPARIAEEWSVVDNLSGGRVGVSFASGWSRGDFLLAPRPYEDRRAACWQAIETIRGLWRGDPVECVDVRGETYTPSIYPKPVQRELPTWVTTTGSQETARTAGAIGANLLTHLIGQSFVDLRALVEAYRGGRLPGTGSGTVTVMLHTFVHSDGETAARLARGPIKRYLRNSMNLSSASLSRLGLNIPIDELTDDDWDALLDLSTERYLRQYSLIGTVGACHEVIAQLAEAGVDEVACLIDFGVAEDMALRGLGELHRLSVETANICRPTRRPVNAHPVDH